jgi:hypothetical protein
MATCPQCGGFLHDGHRCRAGWRRRGRSAGATLFGAAAGALLAFALADRPPLALILTCGVLGVVLISAFRRFAKF